MIQKSWLGSRWDYLQTWIASLDKVCGVHFAVAMVVVDVASRLMLNTYIPTKADDVIATHKIMQQSMKNA